MHPVQKKSSKVFGSIISFEDRASETGDSKFHSSIHTNHKKPLKASTFLKSPKGLHHAKLGQYAASLYKNKEMTDVLIVVQGQEFKAHKAVLACYSPYFAEVLVKPGFSDVHYLQLPSVTAKAFSTLLDYMYTGDLKLTCQEFSEVYRSARKLGVNGALKKCIELLHVTSDKFQNVVYLFVSARKLDLLDASIRSFKMMLTHFERLVMTKEFLDLQKEHILELLNSDEIGARSEVIVFLAGLKWLNHNYIEREEEIIPVMKCIRFSLMNMEEIIACYHPPLLPGLLWLPQIREAILNATCYIAAKSVGQEALFPELAGRPRRFLFSGEPMVLWDTSVFNPEMYGIHKKIHAVTKIQAAVRGYITRKRLKNYCHIKNGAAIVIQSAYRGYRARKILRSMKEEIRIINEAKKRHSTIKKKSESRSFFSRKKKDENLLTTKHSAEHLKSYPRRQTLAHTSATLVNTCETLVREEPSSLPFFYVMGAYDMKKKDKGQNTIFEFDTQNHSWSVVTKCPISYHDTKMISTTHSLYIIGGSPPLDYAVFGNIQPIKDCYQFQFEITEWIPLPKLKNIRVQHGVACFAGSILVFGGKNEANKLLSSIEKYDTSNKAWIELDDYLPEPRMAFGTFAQDSLLWIVGGLTYMEGKIAVMNTVCCFDLNTNKWTEKAKLPEALAFPAIVGDKENLYCVGGATGVPGKKTLKSVDYLFKYEENTWVRQQHMPIKCHSVTANYAENKIYVFGGFTTTTMSQISKPYYFDTIKKTWNPLDSIPGEAAGYIVTCSK